MAHYLGHRSIHMNRRLPVAIIALCLGVVLTVIGCTSTEDQWLGQDKQGRVRQVGPPDNCTGTPTVGGELCEWRTNGNSLRYRYDTKGIAQSWAYTNRQLGVMERAEDQASQGGMWQSITKWFTKEPKLAPGSGS